MEVKGGAEALSASGPVVFCEDEDGGWDISKTLNWTLMAEWGLWKEDRPLIHGLTEGQASAHP